MMASSPEVVPVESERAQNHQLEKYILGEGEREGEFPQQLQ